jgi:hypothetical protein
LIRAFSFPLNGEQNKMPMKINSTTTKTQLQDYALNELGIKLDKDALDRDEMIAAVREAEGGAPSASDLAPQSTSNGAAGDQQDDDEDDAPAGTIEALVKKEKKLKLSDITDFTRCRAVINVNALPAHDEESEPDSHVTVGYNGVFYQVITGEEVEVPYGVYDILKNTRQTRYHTKKDSVTGQNVTTSKEVLRVPHNLISVTVVE